MLALKTENKRDHIIAALKSCNWKVYGPGGAADLTEMNFSAFNPGIKKLGIKKFGFADRTNP